MLRLAQNVVAYVMVFVPKLFQSFPELTLDLENGEMDKSVLEVFPRKHPPNTMDRVAVRPLSLNPNPNRGTRCFALYLSN